MESFRSARSPVFIIGSYRSGTSVLTWCLGQLPNVLLVPETYWIYNLCAFMPRMYKVGSLLNEHSHWGCLDWNEPRMMQAFGEAVDQMIVDTKLPIFHARYAPGLKPEGMDEETFMRSALDGSRTFSSGRNFEFFRSLTEPKRRWVDGTPENTGYTYGLAQMFPNAKFVHILRDPHEVARSLMHFSRAGGNKDYGEREAYGEWSRLVTAAHKTERAFGKDRVFRIHYEELIADPERILSDCCAFLGEEFAPECLFPLRERINSSKVEGVELNTQSGAGQEAEALYRKVRASAPTEAAMDGMQELRQIYDRQIGNLWLDMAAAPPVKVDGGGSRYKRLLKKLVRKVLS